MQSIENHKFRDPNKVVSLWLHAVGGEEYEVKDIREFERANRTNDTFRLNRGVLTGFQSSFVGGCEGQEMSAFFPRNTAGVNIRCGSWIDSIEFIPGSAGSPNRSIVGGPGGGSHEFYFDPGEYITGFYIRAGGWIDGIQVITNKRRGQLYGSSTGGAPLELVAPQDTRLLVLRLMFILLITGSLHLQ